MVVTLAHSDLHGREPTTAELIDLVSTCSAQNLLWKLSVVGTLASRAPRVNRQAQQALARQLLPDPASARAAELLGSSEHQVFVHQESLVVGAIVALAYASDAPGDEPGDADPYAVGRIVAMLNDLLAEGPREWSIDDGVRFALRNEVFGATERAANAIARYYDLLAARSRVSSTRQRWDLDATFSDAYGLSLEEFWTLGWAHYAVFSRLRAAADLDRVQYGRVRLTPTSDGERVFGLYSRLVSRQLADVREELHAHPPTSLAYAEVEPFLRRPLIELPSGALMPVWLPWFADKLGPGARWLLQDAFAQRSSHGVQDFNAYLGALWEDYVFDLLDRSYPSQKPLRMLYRPVLYGHPPEESNDATLFLGDNAVFFEATVSALPARISWTGDVDGFRDWVRQRMYTGSPGKVAKLARRIDDFVKGKLVFDGINRSHIRHIIPVLVTLTPYPRNPITAVAFAEEARGVLTEIQRRGAVTIHSLRSLSAEDLEMAESLSAAGEFQFADELKAWEASGVRDWPFKNYVFATRSTIPPNAYLRRRFEDITEFVRTRAPRLIDMPPAA